MYVGNDNHSFCARIVALLQEIPDDCGDIKLMFFAAAILIRKNVWHSENCYITRQEFTATVINPQSAFIEIAKRASSSVYQNAVTELAYLKVNWWFTNHHIDSPHISDLILKILEIGRISSIRCNKADPGYTLLWIISHWVDTHRMLNTLGFTSGQSVWPTYPFLLRT